MQQLADSAEQSDIPRQTNDTERRNIAPLTDSAERKIQSRALSRHGTDHQNIDTRVAPVIGIARRNPDTREIPTSPNGQPRNVGPPAAQRDSQGQNLDHVTEINDYPPPYSKATEAMTPPSGNLKFIEGLTLPTGDLEFTEGVTPPLASPSNINSMQRPQPVTADVKACSGRLNPRRRSTNPITFTSPAPAEMIQLAEELQRSKLQEEMARKRREHKELELQMMQLDQVKVTASQSPPPPNTDDITEMYLTHTNI